MLCSDVRAHLLAPDAPASAALSAHIGGCAACSAAARASAALDRSLRLTLLAAPPAELQARLLALEPLPMEAALRSSLVVEPPRELQASLLALVAAQPQAAPAPPLLAHQGQAAVRPIPVLVGDQVTAGRAAVPVAGSPTRAGTLVLAGWWRGLVGLGLPARPGVLLAQLAALAVLVSAIFQVASWVATLPLVLGDVPYALELLLWSPAVEYLAQVQGLLQQLGLWLLVAAAGWLLTQVFPWQRQPTA